MRIGLVSVTINALIPMENYVKKEYPEVKLTHYLDCGLQDLVKREGTVTPEALCRLISIFEKAIKDGVEALLLTCTVFSPYVQRLRSLFPTIPIFSADGAMLREAVGKGRKLALIYTFPATLESSTAVFQSEKALQESSAEMTPMFVEGANDATASGNKSLHDSLIEEKIQFAESQGFDTIVLAQISMAHMARTSKVPGCTIFSSPKSAVLAVLNWFRDRKY